MRGFLSEALKTNEALDFAVLTGVTRVSKESIFSGLNNLDVCGVLSDVYADIFGFTRVEVKDLMSVCGVVDKLSGNCSAYSPAKHGKQAENPSVFSAGLENILFRFSRISTPMRRMV